MGDGCSKTGGFANEIRGVRDVILPDIYEKYTDIVVKHTDVVDKHADVVDKHAEVVEKQQMTYADMRRAEAWKMTAKSLASESGTMSKLYTWDEDTDTFMESFLDVYSAYHWSTVIPYNGGYNGIAFIDTVSQLQNVDHTVSTAVIVKGRLSPSDGAGGLFVYDENRATEYDGGTVFYGWVRVFSGATYLKWFGAVGGSDFENKTGTDDTQALIDALAYGGTIIVDDYFTIYGQINMPENVTIQGTVENNSGIRIIHDNTETGIKIVQSNVSILDIEVQAHCTAVRGEDQGNLGNCICIGEFFTTSPHDEVKNVKIRAKLTRSKSTTGDYSNSAPAMNIIGNASYCDVDVNIDGGTTKHSLGFQSHWGGYNTNSNATEEPVETYHPHDNKIRLREIKNVSQSAVVLSSVYNYDIGDINADGVYRLLLSLPGDNINKYASEEIKHLIGKGIKIGSMVGKNIEDVEPILISYRGTSKFEKYAGTDIYVQHQIEAGIEIQSILLHGNEKYKAVRITGTKGVLNIGNLSTKGYEYSLWVESSKLTGKITVDDTEGKVLLNGSEIQADISITRNSDATSGTSVSVENHTENNILSGVHNIGDTVITLANATTYKIHETTKINIGDEIVIPTGVYDTGVTQVSVKPLKSEHLDGTEITIVDKANLTGHIDLHGGYYAVKSDNEAKIDLRGTVTGAGRYGIMSTGGSSAVIDVEVVNNGTVSTSGNDFYVGANSSMTIHNKVMHHTQSDNNIKVLSSGYVNVIGGKVLDPSKLLNDSSIYARHDFIGVVDKDGVKLPNVFDSTIYTAYSSSSGTAVFLVLSDISYPSVLPTPSDFSFSLGRTVTDVAFKSGGKNKIIVLTMNNDYNTGDKIEFTYTKTVASINSVTLMSVTNYS